MKYISKELGTQKQYQELLACLDENSPCNPRDTAETMVKIACYYRNPNSAYADNLELFKLVAAFAERHIADEEILWRCIRTMGALGSLSVKKRSKKYCYQFLWRFCSHSNKRVRFMVSWQILYYFDDLLLAEPDWFDYAFSTLAITPANDTYHSFSLFLDWHVDAFSREQLAAVLPKYEKFLSKTKYQYYQKRYTTLVRALKQHIAGETVLQPRKIFNEDGE